MNIGGFNMKNIFGFLIFLLILCTKIYAYDAMSPLSFKTIFSESVLTDNKTDGWYGMIVDIPEGIYNNVLEDIKNGSIKNYPKLPVKTPYFNYPQEDRSWLIYYGLSEIPAPIGGTGFLVQGNNHSDDMDYWIFKKIEGKELVKINRNQIKLKATVTIVSNHAKEGFGVGGSERFDLYVTAIKKNPSVVVDKNSGHVRLDPSILNIGEVSFVQALGDSTVNDKYSENLPFKEKNLRNMVLVSFDFDKNSDTNIWIGIGFHSGFESFSGLFYKSIKLDFF
jgi:hypothetical protein